MHRLRVFAGGGLIAGLLTASAFAPATSSATSLVVRHEVMVVVLERDVTEGGSSSLIVSPEREIARYIGVRDIATWVRRGAPLP